MLKWLLLFAGTYPSIINHAVLPQMMSYNRLKVTKQLNSKPFNQILLAINFNHPYYSNIPLLNKYFQPVFEKIIYCGPEQTKEHDVVLIKGERGYFGYMCLAEGIKKFPNYSGYLYINDDMIVNWWNMVNTPRDKIWFGKDIINEAGANMNNTAPCCWHWWTTARALEKCKNAFTSLQASSLQWNGKEYFDIYFENTKGVPLCQRAWSDFMYIPHRLSKVFQHLANEFYKNGVFLEVAVSTLLSMLDKNENRVNLDGVYLPDLYGDADFSDGVLLSKIYNPKKSFYHPVKLSVHGKGLQLFNTTVRNESKKYLKMYSNSSSRLSTSFEPPTI